MVQTIQISDKIYSRLKTLKNENEKYDEVIQRLLNISEEYLEIRRINLSRHRL